jgi:fucose 4-O-acetylase-like acetyltransferase
MVKYLDYTGRVARETPASRNRVIDFWRAVAILTVVFGHWLAASIWLQPNDEIELMNSLQWIPYAAWVTWIVQVMPIFFFVGGYANARGLSRLEAGEETAPAWITKRVRRLFTPVIPLVVVWTLLIVATRWFVPAEVVHAGAMSATVPLWFVSVYLMVTAMAPWTHRWWRRHPLGSITALAAAAIAVDAVRFGLGVELIGWINYVFVWGLVHQAGYWWADRDRIGRPIRPRTGWAIFSVALSALIVVTWAGWYPVAMVGIPGAEITNMTPPTFGIALLGTVQAGIILGTRPAIERLTRRLRVWHVVVAVSGVLMTIFLWHLGAMSLVAAVGLFTFDGAMFRIEPGTTAWWLTRPLWLLILSGVTIALVAVFAPFEWKISKDPPPAKTIYVTAGVLLCAGSAAAIAYFGLATTEAAVNWIIPVAAIVGAGLVGAYPAFGRLRDGTGAGSARASDSKRSP